MDIVRLRCVKEDRKLRVKIISPGYNAQANCQFPRAIRKEGQEYTVPASAITFSEGANRKFFYRVKKNAITIVNASTNAKIEHVYGDDEVDMDCVICMAAEKDVVFAPCGHYCSCDGCAKMILSNNAMCPMCRTKISQIVKRDQIQ